MLPRFVRRILGPASFPRHVGQGLPDPAERSNSTPRQPDLEERHRVLYGEAPVDEEPEPTP